MGVCENCGCHIRKGDSYCPKCGMELLVSEYKPLKKRYIRGEYYDEEEEQFYEDGPVYPERNTGYEDEYDYDNEETESSGGMLPIILFLVVALLIGFIFGIIIFSSYTPSLTSFNWG